MGKLTERLPSRESGPTLGSRVTHPTIVNDTSDIANFTALFFVSVHCMHCIDLLPYIGPIQTRHNVNIIVYSTGDEEDHQEMKQYFEWDFPVNKLSKQEMEETFQVKVLPFVLLLNPEGTLLGKSVVINEEDFNFMVRSRGGIQDEVC